MNTALKWGLILGVALVIWTLLLHLFGFYTTGWFDEHGVLSCQAAFAGDLEVEGVLTLRDPTTPSTTYLKASESRVIRVEAHDAEQLFLIRFDPAELEAAIRSLGTDH